MSDELRTCRGCGATLSLERFEPTGGKNGGRRGRCRACTQAQRNGKPAPAPAVEPATEPARPRRTVGRQRALRRHPSLRTGRRWDAWMPQELALIREVAGTMATGRIGVLLGEHFGVPRSASAVRKQAWKAGISLWPERTISETARLFGVGWGCVMGWHRRGLLVLEPQAGPGSTLLVRRAALERFITEHPYAYEWRRMQPGPFRTMAEIAWRRDPWLTKAELVRALGITTRWLDELRQRGMDFPHRVAADGRARRVWVRASDVWAIREAMEAKRLALQAEMRAALQPWYERGRAGREPVAA